ncbi:hypothetical protein BD626DRAFT_108580 [Schizophyllum amplum]|uniref:Uncharacterized protein n=1 Tax=Schizophyllum amplum TaxID=97359 RepID=A0A550CT32_9AGAR|nr:hypothetical protein BD626DRAFT_108580 [Auriculariopsis ampla]
MSSSSDDDPVRGNPVSRDGFFYDGHKFYVKIDDKHEHTRCPASDLHALLAHYPPAGSEILPKTQAPKPRKDEPAHFYTAQMVHYGVPKPMKTRDPAKRKLSAAYALNSGASIAVPENILKLESELIQEYRAGGNGAAGLASVEDETSTACRTSAHTVGDDYLWGPDLRCCLERYSQKDLVDLLMRVADDDSDSATLINKKLWKLRNHDPDNSRSAAEPSKPRSKQTARRTGGLPFGTRADKREVSKFTQRVYTGISRRFCTTT